MLRCTSYLWLGTIVWSLPCDTYDIVVFLISLFIYYYFGTMLSLIYYYDFCSVWIKLLSPSTYGTHLRTALLSRKFMTPPSTIYTLFMILNDAAFHASMFNGGCEAQAMKIDTLLRQYFTVS